MPEKGKQYVVDALKCRDGVMNGSRRFREIVLASEAGIRPYTYEGMEGFLLTESGKRWWTPIENVVEVRFGEPEKT